ncbi:unnamed protein product [Strongylus vulgaris]|uniref:Uncharacterized protein n=1 Tax=Strongylus vulgaris TaxID=40348 RepID=A0A3P7J2B9_STRVU|nr:unnamed protein product [Strongylus vulgaris]
MKQEIVMRLKGELENCKNTEGERKQKREDTEKKRVELKKRIFANLAQTRTLSAEMDNFGVERVALVKNDHEVRAKLADFRARISGMAENRERLESSIVDLRHSVIVDPTLISGVYVDNFMLEEVQNMAQSIANEVCAKKDCFDMTAVIAEVQAIENLRTQRLELTEKLAAKTEMLSALEGDNGKEDYRAFFKKFL